jgi:hypothetical protein
LVRAFEWKTIDWYGQLGGDSGRDIWGVREAGATECFQCANHRALKFKKAEEDLAKLIAGSNGLPTKFTLITGGRVSADVKEKVVAQALALGIREAEVWSGPEFEERLRRDEPLLIRRFVEGVFTTEFRSESNIPDFKKAITDTIEALNTGVRRLRDGTEVGRIPRKAHLKDPAKRAAVEEVVELLVELRARFDQFVTSGDLRPCGCGNLDCPTYSVQHRAALVMDGLCDCILHEFDRVAPGRVPRLRRRW